MEVNESDPAGAANLEKVDHVVVVMLENRSFDHMLGYLSLTGRRPDIDGLRPGLANQYQGRSYPAHHLAATALDLDPDHSAGAIDQQIAGGDMSGFVASAAATLAARGVSDGDPGCVMGYYDGTDVPVYDHLAAGVRGLRPLVQLGGRCHAAQPPVRLDRGGRRKPGRPAVLLTAPVPPALLRPSPAGLRRQTRASRFLSDRVPARPPHRRGLRAVAFAGRPGCGDILDMEFITKDADGKSKKVDVWEFAVPDGVDLSAWAGASSGLLDDSDVGEISAAMQPGSVAVVVIYENLWALGLVDAWRRDGARLIASGGLSAGDIVAALDAAESS